MPQTRHFLQPEHAFELKSVSDPQLSPDGKWIACVITRMDKEQDKFLSDLWLVAANGRKRVQLTNRHHKGQRAPLVAAGRPDRLRLAGNRGGEGQTADLGNTPRGRRSPAGYADEAGGLRAGVVAGREEPRVPRPEGQTGR